MGSTMKKHSFEVPSLFIDAKEIYPFGI